MTHTCDMTRMCDMTRTPTNHVTRIDVTHMCDMIRKLRMCVMKAFVCHESRDCNFTIPYNTRICLKEWIQKIQINIQKQTQTNATCIFADVHRRSRTCVHT